MLKFVAYFVLSATIVGFGMWQMGDLTPLDREGVSLVAIGAFACALFMQLRDLQNDWMFKQDVPKDDKVE